MSTAEIVAPKLLTAEDLLALGPDFHGELVRGRIIEMPPAGGLHGVVAMRVAVIVGGYIDQHRLGVTFAAETGFTIERSPDTVRAPDFAFIRADRMGSGPLPVGFLESTPDLAVEVLSPRNTVREIADKVRDFLANGCSLVWVFNPTRKTVTVHAANQSDIEVLGGNDVLTGGNVLAGFSRPVADFFP